MTTPYIYVIIEEEELRPCKIGIAVDMNRRLIQLQGGNPRMLNIFTLIQHHRNFLIEKEIKFNLDEEGKKLMSEWYNITAIEMTKRIASLFSKYPNLLMTTEE